MSERFAHHTLQAVAELLAGAEAMAAEHPADAAAVALLTVCAVRVGELVTLTVGQVVPESWHHVLVLHRRNGDARIPIPPRVRALVEPLLPGRAASSPLLIRTDGRPFKRPQIRVALRRAARTAQLSDAGLTAHAARSTAAAELLNAGVPLPDVQHLLGHASSSTTQRYQRPHRMLDSYAAYQMAALLSNGDRGTTTARQS